jgi:hypothetical protein
VAQKRNTSGLRPGGQRYRVIRVEPSILGPITVGHSYVADQVARGVSEVYTDVDALHLRDWLNDRDSGYKSLRKFEGGANWPYERGIHGV